MWSLGPKGGHGDIVASASFLSSVLCMTQTPNYRTFSAGSETPPAACVVNEARRHSAGSGACSVHSSDFRAARLNLRATHAWSSIPVHAPHNSRSVRSGHKGGRPAAHDGWAPHASIASIGSAATYFFLLGPGGSSPVESEHSLSGPTKFWSASRSAFAFLYISKHAWRPQR